MTYRFAEEVAIYEPHYKCTNPPENCENSLQLIVVEILFSISQSEF